ncbi:beta-1,3-galactosyltransferase 5 [Achroia grisella]|uniref:beta-1,3-galactosyltransferase 5 n=1 Tax=Achroia grisella TaxID=688607 RepID=UPI0027D22116|nr:beta-1,3-galactosyltransferase 5 [Achroia grisella]
MKRKYINFLLIFIATLVTWIWWSSNNEVNNTILFLKQNNYYIKDTLISPSSEACIEKQFLVIIVTSYVGHVELRSIHRRAMPSSLLKSMNITRIFLLAKIPPNERYITQEAIKDESRIFDDILQGSFQENYRNLTYKHLMGLQWASTVCIPSYILKVDDDIVYNLESTHKLLLEINKSNDNLLMGYMLNNTKPRRNKQNKWYVTWEEYPRNEYPPYLSGWYYITTSKIAARICEEAIYHPYFWIDDIFVTGIVPEVLDIKLKQLPKDYWLEYYELLECCLTDMVMKSIQCHYVVGPNGGRDSLLLEFNEALRNCDNWKNCTQRTSEKSLKDVCVVNKERNIFSKGNAEVHFVSL